MERLCRAWDLVVGLRRICGVTYYSVTKRGRPMLETMSDPWLVEKVVDVNWEERLPLALSLPLPFSD